MDLNIKERIYIPQLLPQQNTFKAFNLKKSILEKVEITEKDRETYDIKEDRENNKITWNIEKDMELPLVVDFSKEEIEYLKSSCEKLTDTAFPDDFWPVVEKIYDAAGE